MKIVNWKTTLLGILTGGLNLYANGMRWQEILLSIGLATLGGLAKDRDVTGGTIPSGTPESVVRVSEGTKALQPAAVVNAEVKQEKSGQ